MYWRIDGNQRMTDIEASEQYPDSYIIMQMDNMHSDMGIVLYVGDNEDEIIKLAVELKRPFCGVIEGLNFRRSLGGIVVGG